MTAKRFSQLRSIRARARARRMQMERLERRDLLAGELGAASGLDKDFLAAPAEPHPILAPDSDPDVVDYWTGPGHSLMDAVNLAGSRWTNPTGGPSPNFGDTSTVTWSIVPDGTPSAGTTANATSNLIAFMDGIYGNGGTTVAQRPWFRLFKEVYDNWSTLTGLNFVYEPNDDGAPQGNAARGVVGVRGDVRIAGSLIDGNSNVLAFNYFPNSGGSSGLDGDMVIDTGDNFYANNSNGPNGENRGLVNVLTHEAGHGIGLGHTIPVDQTKLMEPFVNFAFIGPQHDDILAAQSLYGDRFINNDTQATAADIGALSVGNNILIDDVSIDANNDIDWYSFDAVGGNVLNVTLKPDGFSYDLGAQGGTVSRFDSSRLSDLRFEVYDPSGRLIAREDRTSLGKVKSCPHLLLRQQVSIGSQFLGTRCLVRPKTLSRLHSYMNLM